MAVEFRRLVSMTAGIVNGLAWSALAEQGQALDFEFCVDADRVPARLTIPANFPAALPEIHLRGEIVRANLVHVDDVGKLCFCDEEGLSLSLRDETGVLAQVLHDARAVLAAGLAGTNQGDVLGELGVYWALHCQGPAKRVALNPGGRVKSLDLWAEGTDIVLIADRSQGRFRFGQHTAQVSPERFALYMPLPGNDFDRVFIDSLAGGQVPLRSCAALLDGENRTILASKLKKKRRFDFIVFGVEARDGERALIGVELTPAVGRESFEVSVPGSSKWAPLNLTRVDRGALLPRGGVRDSGLGEHAMVIGCDAIGGHVATAIARTGLRRLTLIDPEDLAVDNIYRHSLGFADVGQPKVTALADRLREALPHLDVRARTERGEQLPDALFDRVDLVLVTIGAPTVHRVLNERLHARGCRVVFGWLEPMGIGGHALLTSADGGGCLECLFLEPDGGERLTAWSDFAAPDQRFARQHAGCAGAFTPFADLDARRTANLVVELGLEALSERDGPGSLRSWLGPTKRFVEAGFDISDYRRRGELVTEFRQTRCPVCAGWT